MEETRKYDTFFTTDRLIIRSFVRTDFSDFLKIHQNPAIMKYFISGPKTLLQAKKKFEFILKHQKEYGFSYWAVLKKENNEFVGQSGIVTNQDGTVNLLFAFLEKHWGKGYGTEVGRAIIDHCFRVLKIPVIRAMVMPENVKSHGLIKKLGLDYKGDRTLAGGTIASIYEMTKDEYFQE